MPYDKTEIYQPAGRPLTEAEYNELMEVAPWNNRENELKRLRHELKLKELAIDSATFYLKYQADDLRQLSDNQDDVDTARKLRMLAHEAERVMFKLNGLIEQENRVAERINIGKWITLGYGEQRRALRLDRVNIKHFTSPDNYILVGGEIYGFGDNDTIEVWYSIGENDNTDDYHRFIQTREIEGYREYLGD